MKRAAMPIAVGALILGSALSAMAQAPAGPTVSFSGQFRFLGFVTNNVTDYHNSTNNGLFRDSESDYTQRLRLKTTIESADKTARVVWHVEVGDITAGNGGGAAAYEYGGPTQTAPGAAAGITNNKGNARVGNGSGGGLGADGINVETKNAYLQLNPPWFPNSTLTLGIQNVTFLATPVEFLSDDMVAIKLNMKFDPVDVELVTAKISENNISNADDNDLYGVRVGIAVAKDWRVTLEGFVINAQCFDRVGNTPTGACVKADLGDLFWGGATVGGKIGDISLDAAFVYGQRELICPTCAKGTASESGFGLNVAALIPIGALTVHTQGWYTTGDNLRAPGAAANGILVKNSDKLPIPEGAGSWYTRPLIAEVLAGYQTIGGPGGANSPYYADLTGTFGIGGSAIYALTPAFSLGGGVAFVGATDRAGLYGDSVIELDGGMFYTYNANVGFQAIGGVLFPDKGDTAWSMAFRTVFNF